MTENTRDRYNFENLPISEKTRKGLTDENINYIGAVGRMLSLQDDFIEGILGDIHRTLVSIELRLDTIEQRLTTAEEKAEVAVRTAETAVNKAKIALGKAIEDEAQIADHERRLVAKDVRITNLETGIAAIQPELIEKYMEQAKEYGDDIHKVKPVLDRIVTMFKWWKIAIYVAIVAVIVSLFVLILHKNGLLAKNNKQGYGNTMTAEEEMKIINAPTRSVHFSKITGTKAYRDSVNDAIIEQNEKDIQASIDARNKIYAEK